MTVLIFGGKIGIIINVSDDFENPLNYYEFENEIDESVEDFNSAYEVCTFPLLDDY